MMYVFDPVAQLVALSVAFALVHLSASSRAFQFGAHTVLFALLTAVLLANGIEPYMASQYPAGLPLHLFYGAAKVIWWIGGALMLVSSVRLFIIFEGRPREARLIQDLVAGLIYVGATLAIVAYVFNVPVGTLIATSGVVAVILGLALQSTLSDVFSGIALNLGRPYAVGDWIVLDNGMQGRVVETNWRATHLLNVTNDLVVVPNTSLAKSQLVNSSSPDETHGVALTVRVVATQAPSEILELFETILVGSRHVLQVPAPFVSLTDMDGHSIGVELVFRVSGVDQIVPAKNEMFGLIFRHLGAAGLALSGLPISLYGLMPPILSVPASRKSSQYELIRAMPVFAVLSNEEIDELAASLIKHEVPKGAKIIDQGIRSSTLMLVGRGVVLVQRNLDGKHMELNRLSPGDFFGERGVLMGSEEPGSITALSRVVVYEVPSVSLAKIMQDRPILADELGSTLAARLETEALAEGGIAPAAHGSMSIAQRIRHLFQLPTPHG